VINGIPGHSLLPHAASITFASRPRPKVRPVMPNNTTRGPEFRAGILNKAADDDTRIPRPRRLPRAAANFESSGRRRQPFAVVVATSIRTSRSPLKRLLVSAVARVEPTGLRWVDQWKRESGRPGEPSCRSLCGPGSLASQGTVNVRARQHRYSHRQGVENTADGGGSSRRQTPTLHGSCGGVSQAVRDQADREQGGRRIDSQEDPKIARS